MPKVQLPKGCRSLAFNDGGKPAVADREGGHVDVSDRRAAMIDSMAGNGDAGLVGRAGFHEYGTVRKPGRVCTRCGFRAYAWSLTCPRASCGAPTEPE
jgi:hypothetical protein